MLPPLYDIAIKWESDMLFIMSLNFTERGIRLAAGRGHEDHLRTAVVNAAGRLGAMRDRSVRLGCCAIFTAIRRTSSLVGN
jgi:hypothetical protein